MSKKRDASHKQLKPVVKYYKKIDDKNCVIGIGITQQMVINLKAGDVIAMNMADIEHPDITVVLFYGKTRNDIIRSVKQEVTDGDARPEVSES